MALAPPPSHSTAPRSPHSAPCYATHVPHPAVPQDSGADGAGYETDIKGGALAARPAKKAGTAKAKKGTGKGLFGK
jgi:hypothetical protein